MKMCRYLAATRFVACTMRRYDRRGTVCYTNDDFDSPDADGTTQTDEEDEGPRMPARPDAMEGKRAVLPWRRNSTYVTAARHQAQLPPPNKKKMPR